MIFFLSLFFIGIIYPQCDTHEVEIWDTCYPIETTTVLHNTDNTFGEFPVEICSLINLEVLDLEVMWGYSNFVTGQIQDCIGDLVNLNYLNSIYLHSFF